MDDYLKSLPGRWYFHLAAVGVLLLAIIVRAGLTLNSELNIDEFEHLHAAWMVAHHFVIYRDFGENHTPLFYYVLVPLFRICREGSHLVLIVRIIMSTLAAGILLLTYAIARIDRGRLSSFVAVLILSWMVIFAEKSIEIRPDSLLVVAWLAALLISVRTSRGESHSGAFLAGVLLGTAFSFSPKALLAFAALSLTPLTQVWLGHPRRKLSSAIRIQTIYTIGFLIPIGFGVAFFYHAGILRMMFESTVLQNLNYSDPLRPLYLFHLRNSCFILLAFVGVFLRLIIFRARPATARELALMVPTSFLFILFVSVQTAPYPQSVLLFAPMLAIYAADAFIAILARTLRPRQEPDESGGWAHAVNLGFLGAALAAAFLIPGFILFKTRPFTSTNAEQLRRMDFVLQHTQPNDVVFDGEAAYVFRPQAYYYGSLFHSVLNKLRRGEVMPSIPESLARSNCKVVIYDERISELPSEGQIYIKKNYAASSFPEVYFVKPPIH
jgi:Dolichyl-phosphate-mannose-protein mannosyltransferase